MCCPDSLHVRNLALTVDFELGAVTEILLKGLLKGLLSLATARQVIALQSWPQQRRPGNSSLRTASKQRRSARSQRRMFRGCVAGESWRAFVQRTEPEAFQL